MIAGTQLANGYWRAPELTGRAFRMNPFKADLGASMYDTGDLAMVDASGNLIWIGRADNQVKVRGYRVELGEIEIVLRSAPGVHDAVVFLEPSGHDLAAAIVPETAQDELGEESLREYLSRRLPVYMIPARFHALPEFPLNPNGKIDRRAVRDMVAGRP